ncbi:related to SCRO protein [Cephalotrichum gorgonifer]|uniref:Defective in cullin neddylation protein n=1 Tax=Cephalotrichum gorgonifer TaxID=2041049 RepID=A0AAE8SVR8_9PEZI|nr:related to SCRO protein [Cephalotrichum gorgonifer]
MAPVSNAQKSAAAQQFMQLTGAPERVAQRFLKTSSYKLNEAIDAYFSNGNAPPPGQSAADTQLDKAFDDLRSDEDPKDSIGVESSMAYLGKELKVNLEDASLFVALEMFQAPSIGEITRAGFVEGWKKASTSGTPRASHLKSLVSSLSQDPAYFKRVYRYAFVVGKEPDQRALGLENAVIFWTMLFSRPGLEWKTASHDWLDLWKTFLDEKWTRSVNRDMWNMTLEFALRSMEDETLGFWSEDGAWPSVIDEFVAWCRETKGIARVEERGDGMDVE